MRLSWKIKSINLSLGVSLSIVGSFPPNFPQRTSYTFFMAVPFICRSWWEITWSSYGLEWTVHLQNGHKTWLKTQSFSSSCCYLFAFSQMKWDRNTILLCMILKALEKHSNMFIVLHAFINKYGGETVIQWT